MTPRLHISVNQASYGSFFSISGDMYDNVPQVVVLKLGYVVFGLNDDSPKSEYNYNNNFI